MLSDGDVVALELWVALARRWAEASQMMVGAAGDLTMSSRELADLIGGGGNGNGDGDGFVAGDRDALADDLRLLADAIETEGCEQRDRYLVMATTIQQYRDLLG